MDVTIRVPPEIAPLKLEAYPPMLLPDDPEAWMHELLAGEAGEFRVVERRPFETELGWSGLLVRAEATGPTPTYCVAAFYRFLHYTAALVVRSAASDAIARREGELLDMFLSARPDWNDAEPVALSEVWRT